jgi:hypothetical protein
VPEVGVADEYSSRRADSELCTEEENGREILPAVLLIKLQSKA